MSHLRPRRDPLSIDAAFAPILAAAQRGSGPAFEELYRWVAPQVAGYFRAQGAQEPEDLTSEVFLGVFRNIKTFSGTRAEFRTWVFSVAHRRLTDERRKHGRRPTMVEPAADDRHHGTRTTSTDAAEEVPQAPCATQFFLADRSLQSVIVPANSKMPLYFCKRGAKAAARFSIAW